MTLIRVPRISTAKQEPPGHTPSYSAPIFPCAGDGQDQFSLLRKAGFEELSSADVAGILADSKVHMKRCAVYLVDAHICSNTLAYQES